MLPERFWSKVDRSGPDECWEWRAGKTHGYGRYWIDGRPALAHRVAYEFLVGPIPEGLEIDHLCRNRACVNPFHMEPVTPVENTLRGNGPPAVNARKTHCYRGHEFTPENTQWKNGKRSCRICKREYERLNWRRWRSAA